MEYFVHLGADSVDAIKQACGTQVEELNVTENGTYTAPSGKAYNPVIVNVESSGGDSDFSTAVEELNVTENGTYTAPSGKAYNPVIVNVESSGGDSDFSTAEVTLINDTDYSEAILYAPITGIDDTSNDAAGAVNMGESEAVYTVILYKGACVLQLNPDNEYTVSGNAEIITVPPLNIPQLRITGDCTVTIADAQ